MKYNLRKIITLTILMTILGGAISAKVETVALKTSFTSSTSCFMGFSKNRIITTAPIDPVDKFPANTPLQCIFVPANSAYESPVFYMYAQVFSTSKLTFEIEAPLKMSNTDKNAPLDKIDYQLKPTEKWATKNGKYVYTLAEGADVNTKKSRVYSNPLQVVIPSKNVEYNNEYSVELTMKVKGL